MSHGRQRRRAIGMRRGVLWIVLALVLCWPVVSGLAAPAHVPGRQAAAGRTGSVAVVALRRQKLAHLTVTAATVNLLPGNVFTGTATVGNAVRIASVHGAGGQIHAGG
jgi:hypothetical protein